MLGRLALPEGRAAAGAAVLGLLTLVALATGVLDLLSFAITVGGALGVAAATFSRPRLAAAAAQLGEALRDEPDAEALVTAMKRLARVYRLEGARALERAAEAEADPFVRRAVAAAVDADDIALVEGQLVAEAKRQAGDIEDARLVLVTLGKLFPAFGLIGTLVGLALLLRNLGGGSLVSVGHGLGIAVQTTLYGALLANAVVLPLATRLHVHAVRRTRRLEMTVDGALLVVRGSFPSQIDAVLRAHLGTPAPEATRALPLRLANRAA